MATDNLSLPNIPTSSMFIGDEDKVMTVEWQEFFRGIFNRVGGTTSVTIVESELAAVSEMYSTPIDNTKEIDELKKKNYAKPIEKSYDKEIAELKASVEVLSSFKSYDKKINELEQQMKILLIPKSYDKRIDDIENVIISEIFTPSRETIMDIYTLLGQNKIQKDLTFSNTGAGAVSLFTVTGDVFVNIIVVITTNIASAASANIQLGVVGYTDAMIVDTLSTDMDAREIWNDSGITNEIENLDSIRKYIITDGNNIILTLDDQVDSGAMTFYCFWSPLSNDGKVEVA